MKSNQFVALGFGVSGKFLCLELVSPAQEKRLRCSVAVFVCWALVVASGLAIYLGYFMLSEQPALIDLGNMELIYAHEIK